MARTPLTTDAIRESRAVLSRFGTDALDARRSALAQGSGAAFADPRALVEWHDLMLFVRAHPAAASEFALAARELRRVATLLRAIA